MSSIKQRQQTGSGVKLWNLKAFPWWCTFSNNVTSKPPQHQHQLRTNCWNTGAYGGRLGGWFSSKPPWHISSSFHFLETLLYQVGVYSQKISQFCLSIQGMVMARGGAWENLRFQISWGMGEIELIQGDAHWGECWSGTGQVDFSPIGQESDRD